MEAPNPALPADPVDPNPRRRSRKRRIALACATAVLVTVGAIAFSNYRSSRVNQNESHAIASLKNISSAQAQMQASGVADRNRNDQGRYGFLSEMAGTMSIVGSAAKRLDPAVLSARWGDVRGGRVVVGGYVFELVLPSTDGGWIRENEIGSGRAIDEGKAEVFWICYAWPADYGWSGKRAFVVMPSGCVQAMRNQEGRYDGDRGPVPGASGFVEPVQGAEGAFNKEDCLGDYWNVV